MSKSFGLSARDWGIIRDIFADFGNLYQQVAVYGSRATGKYRPNSDLDLVVYGCENEKVCRRLYTLFLDSFLSISVDVVSYNHINSSSFKAQIDAVAVPLFAQNDAKLEAVTS